MTLFNRAQMTVSGTPGTGAITLGSATAGYRTFAAAGVTDGASVTYLIEDAGGAWELGLGTYTASGTSLSRGAFASSAGGAAISATTAAVLSIVATQAEITNKRGDKLTGALDWAPIVDVASASTVNLGAQNSNRVRVTGTTAITSFGTTANCLRQVRFAAALTLTHNATTLILPGGANITTQADDTLLALSDGSGNWRVIGYYRANGQPLYVSYANILAAAIATSAEYRANTASKILTTDQVWAAAAVVQLTSGTTVNWDLSAGIDFALTLGQNCTLAAPSAIKVGQKGLIDVLQPSSGGPFTMSFNSIFKFPGGTAPVIEAVALRRTVLSYYVRTSSDIYLFLAGQGVR